jgi:2-keto-4-pentenoate hydratase/2-oxohepta-3-ene-1,7-dioic acid hydratase in catechol pathway
MNSVLFNDESVYPSKLVCIGKNYAAHIEEMGSVVSEQPVVFVKPNSAISNEVIYNQIDSIDYEAELCFMMHGNKFVAVAFGLDLTKRAVQKQLKSAGLPWERAKAFDGSAVFSPFISFDCALSDLRLEFWVNGVQEQTAHYDLMLTKPNEIKAEIESFMTLENYDVIMTGTPKGVAPIKIGDKLVGQVFADNVLY